MGLYNYQPSPHWHLPSLLLKSVEGLMQQQLTLFLYRNDALHWTERTHRPLHRGFLPRSPVRNPTIRRASFGGLNGHATRANIIPPFEDRADLQRFANSHLTTLATFDPPSIVLPIDFHRASSPSRYRFILPPFPNANASRLIFYNFIEPTGRMVDVAIGWILSLSRIQRKLVRPLKLSYSLHTGRVRRLVFFLFVSKHFPRNFARSRDGVIAGEKKRGDASWRERWCFGLGRPWKQRA